MSSQPPTQNLAPIMPFIEPIEPIELPSVFDLQASATNQSSPDPTDPPSNTDPSQKNPTAWKGKANATNIKPSDQYAQAADKHRRAASQEEAVIEKTRMELEEKISELNQLKNQVEPYRSFIILDYSRLLLKRKPADVIIKPTLCTDSKRRSLLKPNNANVNWPLESSLDHPTDPLAHSKETKKIDH